MAGYLYSRSPRKPFGWLTAHSIFWITLIFEVCFSILKIYKLDRTYAYAFPYMVTSTYLENRT